MALSKTVFEYLVGHLAAIEEEKSKLIEQYCSDRSAEGYEIELLIESYIKSMQRLIKNAQPSAAAGDELPLVAIGSAVEIEDLSNREVFKYRLVSPLCGSTQEGDISFISPAGKSLLLKKPGDEVEVKAPGGVFRYKIKSISLQ